MKSIFPLTFRKKTHTFSLLALVGAIFLALSMTSCKDDENIPDVSDVVIDFQVYRFDSIYYQTDSIDIPDFYLALQKDHPDFLKSYIKVMTSPTVQVTDTIDFLHAMQHPGLIKLYDTTQLILGDFSKERADFAQALRYVKYYFPNKPTPTLYTYESEFSMGAYTYGENLLAVGLDFYLGKDFPYYDPMVFPAYIKRTMTPEYIVPTTMHAYANDLVGDVQGEQFLDYIISNGKVLFLLDHFLPTTPDSIFLGYTTTQHQWCLDNEFNMWSHFIHEELLYSTRMKDFRKLITPSPNSTGMPEGAPGRTGNYMGWQIIKAYMKHHPKTTFEELMEMTDSNKILKQSKYKPRK